MTDMVVHIIGDRVAAAPSATRRMKRRRNPQLHALSPDRVVIVFAVDAKSVEPDCLAAGLGELARDRLDWPLDVTRHHHGLELELPDRVLEFLDRFSRRVHRDHRNWRHTIGIFTENISVVEVDSAASCAPHFLIVEVYGEQYCGRT